LGWGCSSDNNDNGNDVVNRNRVYALFSLKNLSVPGDAGEASIMVQWSETDWEIAFEAGDLVTEVSQKQGGDRNESNQITRIRIAYSRNDDVMARSQTIHITNKLTGEVSDMTIEQSADYRPVEISIDRQTKYQHVDGFGGMYNPVIWSGSYLITPNEMTTMYGADGLGYSILRLMIYPEERHWSADVEAAKYAQQQGALIFASPWDCTDALAETITRADGKEVKHLKHESYEEYAQHIIKYINYMKQNGVNLYAVSIQNEPDMEFTYWLPDEVVEFVKSYGSAIRATGVKLMAPEACGTSPEYTDPILNDAAAIANTDILVGHFYQGFLDTDNSYVKNRYDYICGLPAKLNGKPFWMTEHLFNDGENETDETKWEFLKWEYNLSHLGKELSMSMDGGCSAYIYWYLKRFYGMIGDNTEKSPVPEGAIAKNGYILSHFARYATNMTRIAVTTDKPGMLITAYTNEAGNEITLVMLNLSNEKLNVLVPATDVKEVTAVQTTETVNMETSETGILSEEEVAYILLPGNSIVSARLKY
jgi:glucuronoarabinoxylan endo-1,4-beta-xylanase